MSEEEKAPYVDQAGQKKQDYEKSKATFNKKESTRSKKAKTEEDEGEGSDKSKSDVNDDDEDGVSDEDAEFIERNLDVPLELMISSLPCQFPSKRYRLKCLHHLIVYILKDSSKLRKREIVSSFLTEILLALKEQGTRTGTGSSYVGSASDDNAIDGNDANTDGDNCNADINDGNNHDTKNIDRDSCN